MTDIIDKTDSILILNSSDHSITGVEIGTSNSYYLVDDNSLKNSTSFYIMGDRVILQNSNSRLDFYTPYENKRMKMVDMFKSYKVIPINNDELFVVISNKFHRIKIEADSNNIRETEPEEYFNVKEMKGDMKLFRITNNRYCIFLNSLFILVDLKNGKSSWKLSIVKDIDRIKQIDNNSFCIINENIIIITVWSNNNDTIKYERSIPMIDDLVYIGESVYYLAYMSEQDIFSVIIYDSICSNKEHLFTIETKSRNPGVLLLHKNILIYVKDKIYRYFIDKKELFEQEVQLPEITYKNRYDIIKIDKVYALPLLNKLKSIINKVTFISHNIKTLVSRFIIPN